MTAYSEGYHLNWRPPQLPCTVAGQEVNETSCLVHARIPLSSKKRHNSQREAFFSSYILSGERGAGLVHTVHRTTFSPCKTISHVCSGTLCKIIKPNLTGIESAGSRYTHNLNAIKRNWSEWCSHILPSSCELMYCMTSYLFFSTLKHSFFFTVNTRLLDPKAILNMNLTFPVA